MKLHIQRLVALLLVVTLLAGILVVPASAGKEVTSTGTIWTAYAESGWSGPFGQQVTGILCGSVCPTSPDSLHHGKIIRKATGWFAQEGQYVAQCKYCSDFFTVFESDLNDAYEEQVEKMANPVVTSSSSLLGYPSTNGNIKKVKALDDIYREPVHRSETEVYLLDLHTLKYRIFDGGSSSFIAMYFQAPVSGYYYFSWPAGVYSSGSASYYKWGDTSVYGIAGDMGYTAEDHSKPFRGTRPHYLDASIIYVFQVYVGPHTPDAWSDYTISFSLVPDEASFNGATVVDSSNINSRIGNFPGNFSYKGDNGQMITADNVKIVDETNNNYYNPQTGETKAVTDWSYDYSDRSYNLTLEGGDTATVTYGDKNVVIKEGDTTYNIYYIAEGGGEVDPTPSPTPDGHTHDYTAAVTAEPTCIANGVKTYTCSVCGDSYTEKIPATGHTWVVDRTVNTTYDENGNVIQQGYTIYKCPACGNEYKDGSGDGPPDDGGGSDGSGGILDVITFFVNGITERFGAVVNALSDVFAAIPGMFSGFTAFLGQAFSFLPPEITTVLMFGILAMVLVGVFKLIIR